MALSVGLLLTGCSLTPKDSPSAQHFAKGFKAYQDGDFETAALYLKPLVENDQPAAQLLMARMYANGQGVPESMARSEELRNKAALRIYSRSKLNPGKVDPSSEQLRTLEKRVDYYVNGSLENGAPPPAEETTPTAAPAVSEPEPNTASPSTPSTPEPEPTAVVPQQRNDMEQHMMELSQEIHQDTLSVGRISLSNLLMDASTGEKEAIHQLAQAYKEGLYGIKPDPVQAAAWEKKE